MIRLRRVESKVGWVSEMQNSGARSGGAHKVSAILPTFNSRSFVTRAIDSVLAQEGEYLHELIVVDDASTDGTADYISSRYASEDKIVVMRAETNAGPGITRNLAIAAAQGDWIAPIDADDAWLPDRLTHLMALCGHEIDMVFDNLEGYDHCLATSSGPLFPRLPDRLTVRSLALGKSATTGFDYGFLKPVVSRHFIQAHAIKYPAMRISEDMLFYLECLVHGARTKLTSSAYYVYTTPVGRLSNKLSPVSMSKPDDALVASRIAELADRYQDRMAPADLVALRQRERGLLEALSISKLHDSWVRRNYRAMARQLLTDPRAWHLATVKAARRVRRLAGMLSV